VNPVGKIEAGEIEPSKRPGTHRFSSLRWPHRTPVPACTLVLLGLATYAAIIAQRLPSWYEALSHDSDATAPMVLTSSLSTGDHGTIFLGNAPWYSTLMFDQLTIGLPMHRIVWVIWPALLSLLGAMVLGASLARIAGRWAGLSAAVLAICVSPAIVYQFIAQAHHGTTFLTVILLGSFFAVVVRSDVDRAFSRRSTLAASSLGALTGLNAVSDPLLVVSGVLPLLFAVGLTALLDRELTRRLSILSAITVGCCLGGAAAALIWAAHSSIRYTSPSHLGLATVSQVADHVTLLGGMALVTLGASWPKFVWLQGHRTLVETLLGGAIIIAAAVAMSAAVFRAVRHTRGATDPRARGRRFHTVFWTAVAAANVLALLLTNVAVDVTQIHYMLPALAAVAALVPFLASRPAMRLLVSATICGLVVLNARAALGSADVSGNTGEFPALATALRAAGVSHAYADYWEADALTWMTNDSVRVSPATECGAGHSALCRLDFNTPSGWFALHSPATAVIIDPAFSIPHELALSYGSPVREIRVDRFIVDVYDHDVLVH
jgi:hypothetical protein